MSTAFLFPGQGAQAVGMGEDVYRELAVGRDIFDRAEATTGLDIRKLAFEGPQERLNRTDFAQPAIFTVSAALLETLWRLLSPAQVEAIRPTFLAGLSLGEYTALYAAGAMDFETGVKLVARRGELMQQAAAARPSGMVCVLGIDEQRADELVAAAAEGQILTCANFNCPGQVVLSGQIEACQRAAELAQDFGASGAVQLKVAGAFHSELMAPVAEQFAAALETAEIKTPDLPVLSNVDAKAHGEPEGIKDRLLKQLTSPVRWAECMEVLIADGVDTFYEIGPGRVLAGLLRRIDRSRKCTCINSLEAIEKLSEVSITSA
ncbi:MAG: ACP S-malonyltransferase [Phycisphaerae bacterium]|nr:ACP S-malonyltransferase [Phycisphaerae bacterium]